MLLFMLHGMKVSKGGDDMMDSVEYGRVVLPCGEVRDAYETVGAVDVLMVSWEVGVVIEEDEGRSVGEVRENPEAQGEREGEGRDMQMAVQGDKAQIGDVTEGEIGNGRTQRRVVGAALNQVMDDAWLRLGGVRAGLADAVGDLCGKVRGETG